ncbi:sigma-70 family RNA polymerase sigma factor [Mucilaginibacter sp. RS28]|uniref:Sigma-70 family RNA polymerase sigma factor n=1 Tax=Mucilaginibacter straminoryzae TaxID=2932774 RepID=A0A9X2BC37_9SPHI|nr:sigma-70 family RNA polymerase sigma factor [Mucilaginibacter straminoryzae]MCJ8210482.1 sigma-70 family RNA polymerase sigma factor [Mucilaginibacter straminoryzae]
MIWSKPKDKHHNPTDEQLLQQYRETGELDILGRLYEQYMPLVYGVCLKYLQDEEQSKDAVMQIFEELIVKVTRHEVKQFRGWLYVLSRNYCLMQLRGEKKYETVAIDDVMESAFVLHPDTDDKEEYLNALQRCMEKLNEAQRQSVELFYLREQCYKEIAEKTGYTLNEVKSFIQNGKRNLKICMEKHGGR